MIINVFYGTYFVYKNDELLIIKSKNDIKYFIDNNKIITNNSDYIDCENVLDLRIFNWLLNNLTNNNFLCYLEDICYNSVLILCRKQKEFILKYKQFIQKAFEYTKFYKALNKLFNMKINWNYFLQLKEDIFFCQNIKNKIKDYKYNELEVDEDLINNFKYTFLNKFGKIFPNNTFLQTIDRKKYINLFKGEKNKKYLIDFKNFAPSMLYLYTNNKDYYNKEFYIKYAEYFKIDGKDFKNMFLKWINGAGEKSLGIYFEKFKTVFQDIEILKNKIQNGFFVNYYNHYMFYDKEYSKLGVLIQSTAYDFLLRLYYRWYKLDNLNIKFIFNLFDEFLVSVNNKDDILILFENLKYINYSIKEC